MVVPKIAQFIGATHQNDAKGITNITTKKLIIIPT